MGNTSFRSIDFRPAPPGWRNVYLDDDGSIIAEPMPGWLIEVEVEFDARTCDDVGLTGHRRIVASYMEGPEPEPVTSVLNWWCAVAPGEPLPTPEQALEEHARRREALTQVNPPE